MFHAVEVGAGGPVDGLLGEEVEVPGSGEVVVGGVEEGCGKHLTQLDQFPRLPLQPPKNITTALPPQDHLIHSREKSRQQRHNLYTRITLSVAFKGGEGLGEKQWSVLEGQE